MVLKSRLLLLSPVIFLIGLLISFSGMADHQEKAHHKNIDLSEITLQAGKIHEECLPLRAKQLLNYGFHSDNPLHFNFHYHDKKKGETIYIVGPKVTSSLEIENYSKPSKGIVCLMWANKSSSKVDLKYYYNTIQQ